MLGHHWSAHFQLFNHLLFSFTHSSHFHFVLYLNKNNNKNRKNNKMNKLKLKSNQFKGKSNCMILINKHKENLVRNGQIIIVAF